MSINVLVTGGAGYIGSHTCKYIKSKGLNPIVYDNFVYGHKKAVQWGPYIEGDLLDTELVQKTLKENNIQGVIHFAAYAYVGESVQNPIKYYENNVMGSLSLLKAMRETNVSKIVFSSTCATYGIPQKIPITEDMPQNPINPYGQTKLIVENILQDYGLAYGLKSVALRYFNAAGASPESEIGEDHTPETHAIPLALESAITGREFKVFGTDYPTPDGTCIRDYIHVDDLASAHYLAFKYLEESRQNFTAFNLGTGKGTSVKDILSAVHKVSGKDVNATFAPRRAGDPAQLVADSQKIQSVLGWKPIYTDIHKTIETAYKWEIKKRDYK